jgi:integrase
LRQFIYEEETGQYTNLGNVFFRDLVAFWHEKYASNLAIRTQQGYQSNLNLRILPYFGHLKLSNIKNIHIQNFFDELKKNNIRIDGNKKTFKFTYKQSSHSFGKYFFFCCRQRFYER